MQQRFDLHCEGRTFEGRTFEGRTFEGLTFAPIVQPERRVDKPSIFRVEVCLRARCVDHLEMESGNQFKSLLNRTDKPFTFRLGYSQSIQPHPATTHCRPGSGSHRLIHMIFTLLVYLTSVANWNKPTSLESSFGAPYCG
uniref:Uncharacterized protein n=1 Tax=Romanomermis culicivorax TaxID=13658 RepID=A0A915HJH1_ROMCU